ncbi:MAG: hypothetical protein ACOX32_04305 [Bacteroidaceae bacterium]|jgi:hypothetical protein
MTKRFKLLFVIIFGLLIISCNKKPNLMVEVREIDFLNKSESMIEGRLVHSGILGAERIVVFDTLIMITRNTPYCQLVVYSTNTLDSIGGFCTRGRARNEFLRVYTQTNQGYYKNGHVVIPFVDYLDVIKEVDITESLRLNHTVVINSTECMPIVDAHTIFIDNDLDNRFIYEMNIFDGKNYVENVTKVMVRYTVNKPGTKTKEIKLYRRLVDVSKESQVEMPFSAFLMKHPQKNLIAHPYFHMDYILFFDLDNDKTFAVHQQGSRTFDDRYEDPGNDFTYFSGRANSSNYLFLTYRHGDYSLSEPDLDKRCPELMVFDWDGNFIKSFKMDRVIWGIGYDEKHKKMYGLTPTEDLYEYDLSGLLP